MQFVSGPAGLERCVSTYVQAARREGGDFHGLAQCATSSLYSLRRGDRATRVAREGRRDQYTARRAVFGGAETQARRSETVEARRKQREENCSKNVTGRVRRFLNSTREGALRAE